MGQAFDRDGNVLGEAYGDTKREVFEKLIAEFKNAHEIRIKTINEQLGVERCSATCDGLVCDREQGHDGNHRGYNAQIDEPMFWASPVVAREPEGRTS